ncbi:hypothetical protein [Sphingomonas bacterium]|uniref:hypothetical protein n=1 Tax=Sphingomonas bacterium TaxID=1895847 RepID=UPI0015751FF1|nr:hypothetical protein [Sphingomonas bacterium]
MFDVRKRWVRDRLLRGAGVAALACGWLALRWLFHVAGLRPHQDPSAFEFAAAALGFICLSAGALLATLGEHIFDRVETSERWARRPYAGSEEDRGLRGCPVQAEPSPRLKAGVTTVQPQRDRLQAPLLRESH